MYKISNSILTLFWMADFNEWQCSTNMPYSRSLAGRVLLIRIFPFSIIFLEER